MKTCFRCGTEKAESEYYKDRQKKDGLSPICRACKTAELAAKHDQVRENTRAARSRRKDHYDAKNREYKRKQRAAGKVKPYMDRWLAENKDRVNEYRRAYFSRRRKEDPLFAVGCRVRALVYASLSVKGYTKKQETESLLGCSVSEFLVSLGGKPGEDYELDHICPCAQAQNEEELLKLQHHSNFRWVKAEDNLKKRHHATSEAREMCERLLDRKWIPFYRRKGKVVFVDLPEEENLHV
jgi:hypothetical protein